MSQSDIPADGERRPSRQGWALVGAQAVLFLAVPVAALLPALGSPLWASLPLSIGLIVLGAAGLLAASRHLGRALTPLPQPNGQGLAAHGLYRWVRHPIYTSVLVICLGAAVGAGKLQVYAVVLALVVFFAFKARLEERYLLRAYEGYAAYAATTGRFVPGVGRLAAVVPRRD